MAKHVVQVPAKHYIRPGYIIQIRAILFWRQANEVFKCCPNGGKVLEIGPGPGYTAWLLKLWKYDVTMLDLDPETKPDIVGDVTSLPLEDNLFDCVLAAEVLEHLPFEEFAVALSELARVSRKYVIITLPAKLAGLSILLNLPYLKPIGISIGLPYIRKHKFDGEHYWEMSKIGYSKRRIRHHIRRSGLDIIREFRAAPSLGCYFFVMKVR